MLLAGQTVLAQTLAVSLFKSDYSQGEPVYPTLTVANNTAHSIVVPRYFSPDSFGSSINIQTPGGATLSFTPLAIRDHDEAPLTVAPGETVAESVALFFGRDGWIFRDPGIYQLVASMTVDTHSGSVLLTSAPATLTVASAAADFVDLLSNDTSSMQAGKFLLWMGGDHLADGIAMLDGLVAFAPGSAVASHINVARGWNLSKSFTNYAANATRPPDNASALSFLGMADEAQLPPKLRLQKALAENVCHRREGRIVQANNALRKAYQLYRTHPELYKMGPQISRLGPDPSGITLIVFP